MNRSSQALTLFLAATLFVCVIILSGIWLRGMRVDLTEDRLFTLSDGTQNILTDLQEPVSLRFYFSGKLANDYPELKRYGARVRELLEEYVSISKGRVTLEVIDPEPFTETEDQAVALGMQGAPTPGGEYFYFGLIGANTTDHEEVVPFFSQAREPFLEYDITRLVHKLTNPEKITVGVVSSLPLDKGMGATVAKLSGQETRPFAMYEQLGQFYQLRMLGKNIVHVPRDIDVLLVVHPAIPLVGYLDPDSMYAIDQYVMAGGKAMIFVDPVSELTGTPALGGRPDKSLPRSSQMNKLFKAWGLEMAPNRVVADRLRAMRVGTGGGQRTQYIDYVLWLTLSNTALNREDIVTSELSRVNLASSGALRQTEDASTSFTPLLSGSDDATLLDKSVVSAIPDPQGLLRDFTPTGESYVFAARVTGETGSAFPKGRPLLEGEADEDREPDPRHLSQSTGPINVIAVADTDLFDERFWTEVQDYMNQRVLVPTANNGDFVVNGIDNLAGSSDLIGLRSRGHSNREFTVVQELRRDAEIHFLAEQQALQIKLEESEKRLIELEEQRGGTSMAGAEQDQAVEDFRLQLIDTRKQLRDVQHNLRKGVDRLEAIVKFLNIGLVPILLFMLALVISLVRRRRRQNRNKAVVA